MPGTGNTMDADGIKAVNIISPAATVSNSVE